MKREYDFSKGKRGAVVPPEPGKTRITIRLDNEILDHFRNRVHEMGGGNYQTLINDALREHIGREGIEKAVRRAVERNYEMRALNDRRAADDAQCRGRRFTGGVGAVNLKVKVVSQPMDERYEPKAIEPKWQAEWERSGIYLTPWNRTGPSFTCWRCFHILPARACPSAICTITCPPTLPGAIGA